MLCMMLSNSPEIARASRFTSDSPSKDLPDSPSRQAVAPSEAFNACAISRCQQYLDIPRGARM
jgi:hypothetical protein